MHITIFHYHLLPGGVTQVIVSSAVGMLKYLPEITGITLVCGSEENTRKVLSIIRGKVPESAGEKVTVKIVPELRYSSEQASPVSESRLREILLNRFASGIWWVHNFNLGKNPVYTKSLIGIAESRPDIKMVLQIHDFPECGRFDNISVLQNHVNGPLYPQSKNIRYAVINSRDKLLLTEAGIQKELIFLLDNPVEEPEQLPPAADSYKEADSFFSRTESSYLQGSPILIYPVRSIRRKNTLEAGLLIRLLSQKTNLFVTLPGTSLAEKNYSIAVQHAFDENLIPGVFASGLKGEKGRITFVKQIAASSGIISSSVQEGFGYLFINALQWGKPLFARYLDILHGTDDIFRDQQACFYTEVRIPFSKREKETLKEMYRNNFKRISAIYPGLDTSRLIRDLHTMLREDFIDFSYLPVTMQLEILKKLGDHVFLDDTRRVNKALLDNFEKTLMQDPEKTAEPDLERFSLQKHAEVIKKITNSLYADSGMEITENKKITSNLLASFTKIEYLRLLYR